MKRVGEFIEPGKSRFTSAKICRIFIFIFILLFLDS